FRWPTAPLLSFPGSECSVSYGFLLYSFSFPGGVLAAGNAGVCARHRRPLRLEVPACAGASACEPEGAHLGQSWGTHATRRSSAQLPQGCVQGTFRRTDVSVGRVLWQEEYHSTPSGMRLGSIQSRRTRWPLMSLVFDRPAVALNSLGFQRGVAVYGSQEI